MKKTIIVCISILVVVGISLCFIAYYNKKPVRQLEAYMSENGFNQNVEKKETKYEWIQGKYEIHVWYKDEPGIRYVFGFDADNNIMVTAYNPGNISIEEGKRLKKN